MWTSDAKALHTTDACLQTLRGHGAAVTSLGAVQVSTEVQLCVFQCSNAKYYELRLLACMHTTCLLAFAGQHCRKPS
jgi:hypothetical protein